GIHDSLRPQAAGPRARGRGPVSRRREHRRAGDPDGRRGTVGTAVRRPARVVDDLGASRLRIDGRLWSGGEHWVTGSGGPIGTNTGGTMSQRLVAVVGIVAWMLCGAHARAQIADSKCVDHANNFGRKVSSAENKAVLACIKNQGKGTLMGTVEAC